MMNARVDCSAPFGSMPRWVWPRAAYIHIPFCAHKCGYCDFASLAGSDHLADRYLSALETELELTLEEPREVETVFVGGGTPTRLEPAQLLRLMRMLRQWLPLASDGEWTVEANPGTLDEEKVAILARAGVNRVSLGAQSFQPAVLRVLERNHVAQEVERAVELIRPHFGRWSLDLIFGAPGSTLEDCRSDLDSALALGPPHLSCYGLVYEKGTSLWKQWQAGQVVPVEEEVERQMYELVIDRLENSGLTMYEISNYARPGQESRHNLVYWANDAYFGAGLGAARYVRGTRSSNTREMGAYLRRLESGALPMGPTETLDAEGRARETAVLMLRRTIQGIDRGDYLLRTGFSLDELVGPEVVRYVREGLLDDDGLRVRFSREGIFLADRVLSALL
jgi:oxygen-independent coproporphyrinogen-3 oxidase